MSYPKAQGKKNLQDIVQRRSSQIGYDKEDNPVFLADYNWVINLAKRDFSEVSFHPTSEFNRVESI